MPLDTEQRRLSTRDKALYALGDHSVNLVLSATALLYFKFLIEHGGLSPFAAGLVVWIARIVDAFTDPAMGRLSDATRWRSGRRRPYFLIGAVPFGACFALMWVSVPLASEAARFAYYSATYVCVSLAMTCLSVPYLALLPEMATDYHERTSLNTFRSVAAALGTLAAVAMKPLADWLGGGSSAWLLSASLIAIWLVVPWLAVYAVSFERRDQPARDAPRFLDGLRELAAHRSYRTLATFYVLARIAVDLIGAMLVLYFAYTIGREADFAPAMGCFFAIVILSLPLWLVIARKREKRALFIAGAAFWSAVQLVLYFGDASWPRWILFVVPSLAAVGYAVAELMPWSMLGDVIDEDELATGQRREGMYVGVFTFLRKIGGATAVLAMGSILELSGFVGGLARAEQTDLALLAIRGMTSLAPMAILLLAIAAALRYPLTRERHAATLTALLAARQAHREAS